MFIREATLADAPNINTLSNYLGYEEVSDSAAYSRLSELLQAKHDRVYVAQKQDEIIGWMHCFKANRLTSASFYEIAGLVVCPRKRRMGVAKQLVDFGLAQQPGNWRVRCSS